MLWLTLAAVLASPPSTQQSEEYRFATTLIDAAEVLIRARELLQEGASAAEKSASRVQRDFETLLGFEKAITRIREAKDLLGPYSDAKSEDVRLTAETIAHVCGALEQAFQESKELTVLVLQSRSEDEIRAVIPKMAANTGKIDEIWRTFTKVVALASHVLHDGERVDAAGKVAFLRISAAEKKLLLARLEPMKLRRDAQGNRLAVEAGLEMLRDFLREPWRH